MKGYVKNLLKKQLQNRGVFYQYFPTPGHIHDCLKTKPYEIQFYEIKRICEQLRSTDNHEGYNQLLKEFVPQWNAALNKAKFIGHGIGKDGFNTYRKVEIDGEVLFEKILISFKPHIVDKALWLQNSFLGQVDKHYIHSPALKKYFKGEVITIMYYDYVDLPKIPSTKALEQAVEMAEYLYKLSFEKPPSAFKTIPGYLYELQYIRRYRTRINRVRATLNDKNIDFEKIEGSLQKGRLVYTHLDIKGKNMFKKNTLIDWDEFGIFPAGMEQANIYFRTILWYNLHKPAPLSWLHKNFKPMVPENEWALFELGFLYFLYVFAFKFLQKPAFSHLRKELIQELLNREPIKIKK